MGVILFIGAFFGAISTGLLADKIGRKRVLVLSQYFTCAVCVATFMAFSTVELIILRGMFGFVFGLILPLTSTVISEIVPKEIRGRCMLVMQIFMIFGRIYQVCVQYIFWDSLAVGNWRVL